MVSDGGHSGERRCAAPILHRDPLRLAALDLAIELRREFGPNAHTTVSGLISGLGCAGDLIADRSISAYAETYID